MNASRKSDVYFIIYVVFILIMAGIYFSMPERVAFLEHQLEWWGEFFNS